MLVQRNSGRRRQNFRQPTGNHKEALITEGQTGNNGSRFGALSNHYEDTTLNAEEGRDVTHANITAPNNVEKQQERHIKAHRVRGTRNINVADSSLVDPTLLTRNNPNGPILEPTSLLGDKELISIRAKKQWAREGPSSHTTTHISLVTNNRVQNQMGKPSSTLPVPQDRPISLNSKQATNSHGGRPPDPDGDRQHPPTLTRDGGGGDDNFEDAMDDDVSPNVAVAVATEHGAELVS
jgi:hypothetical protein